VPAGQRGDHEQADPAVPQHLTDADRVGVGEQAVHALPVGRWHAQAAVLHLDRQARGDGLGAQQRLGAGGRELGRVLDQLSDQVDDVGDGAALQDTLDRWHHPDPRGLLHFGYRRPQHLVHAHRPGRLALGDSAAEHGEAL
jgi:hypothetical protein